MADITPGAGQITLTGLAPSVNGNSARVSQALVEVVSLVKPDARLTQVVIEFVSTDNTVDIPPPLRVSGVQAESVQAYDEPYVRATQIIAEPVIQYQDLPTRISGIELEPTIQYQDLPVRITQIGLEVLRSFDGTCFPPVECPTITKTGDETVVQGQADATWEITVSNDTDGDWVEPTTITEVLPEYLTLVSMSGDGWSCVGNVCTRNDTLIEGDSFPPIIVIAEVASDAPETIINLVTFGGCGEAEIEVAVIPPLIVPSRTPVRWALHRFDVKTRIEETG